jgi:L-alanine-DL-glutamate epimerase-like enolase superfamily enzyme
VKLNIKLIKARLRAPFVSASAALTVRELLLVSLEDSEGRVGLGEAAPLAAYDGVSVDDVRAALEDCRRTLARASSLDRAELLARCTDLAVLPQAVAAIDLAMWDLEGRRAGQPVRRLLGAAEPAPVDVNYTIAAADRAAAAAEAVAARAAGYRCVKVKAGIGDDAGRLAAVRAATGPDTAIRIDANGAWSEEEAVTSLRVLEPVGIELCEEPASGVDRVAGVWRSARVAIAIDETALAPGALEQRVCDAVCLKISTAGGITGILRTAGAARAAGYQVYLASTLDGPLGIAGALHAAAVVRPDRPCGLATLCLFDRRSDPLPAREGRIAVPSGPGLGDGLACWYEER